jgi:hypothetical protein
MFDNFLCVFWANTFSGLKIAGNRELNKMRLLSEIANSKRPENEWALVELLFSANNSLVSEERSRKDNSILSALVFPVIHKGGTDWVSKHPGLASVPPPLSPSICTSPWPGRSLTPVWKAHVDIHKSNLEEEQLLWTKALEVHRSAKRAKKEKKEETTTAEVNMANHIPAPSTFASSRNDEVEEEVEDEEEDVQTL